MPPPRQTTPEMVEAALHYDLLKAFVENYEGMMADDEDSDSILKSINDIILFVQPRAATLNLPVFQPLSHLSEFTVTTAQSLLTAIRRVYKLERKKTRKQMDNTKRLADLVTKLQDKPEWSANEPPSVRTKITRTRGLLEHMRLCLPDSDMSESAQISQSDAMLDQAQKIIDENDALGCLTKQIDDLNRRSSELNSRFRALKVQAEQTSDPFTLRDLMRQLQDIMTQSDELRDQSADLRKQEQTLREQILA